VPSVFGYFDDFRLWLRRKFGSDEEKQISTNLEAEKPKVKSSKLKAPKEPKKSPEAPVQNPGVIN